jgi:O-antigen ligase
MSRARSSGGWWSAIALGTVAANGALGGSWKYLVAGCAGAVVASVALTYPLAILLVWLVVGSELESFRVSLPAGIPDVTLTRLAGVGAFGVLVLQSMLRSRQLLPPIRVEKIMIAFFAMVVLQTVLRTPDAGSQLLRNADNFAFPFLYFYLTRNLVADRRDLKAVLVAIVLGGALLSLHGLYQYLLQGGGGGAVGPVVAAGTNHAVTGRAVGPFHHAGEYGGVQSLAFLWGMFLWIYGGLRGLPRMLVLAATALAGAAVVLCLTRSVWLGLILAIGTIAVFDRRWRGRIIGGLVTASVVAGLATVLVSGGPSRIGDRLFEIVPIYNRLVIWYTSVNMALAKPVFGYGTGEKSYLQERSKYDAPDFVAIEWGIGISTHNAYLFTLLQWGIVGLAAFLAVFLALLKMAAGIRRSSVDEESLEYPLASYFIACSVFVLIQGVFYDAQAAYFQTTIYLISGALIARAPEFAAAEREAPRLGRSPVGREVMA